jgi:nicotinamidase-related amidase
MPKSALIVTDMLNRYEHEDADVLMRSVREVVPAVRTLVEAARREDVLIVYVNDNHDDWSAGRDELVEWAMAGADPSLIEPIIPDPAFPFVVKARHSGFYETQLDYMLRRHEVRQLVLAGQVTEQCILYSALDAYVRHYEVTVARDAVAHIHADLADAALEMMSRNMRAAVVPGAEIDWRGSGRS